MDKLKVGIPRALFYYYYKDKWLNFFKNLDIDTVVSPPTNKEILNMGSSIANDEMCLSLKIYLGHIYYLKDMCDYILIPRIDNYGLSNQTCTNFLAIYDIVKNLIPVNILNYNIDFNHHQTELKGFIKIGKKLGKSTKDILASYQKCLSVNNKNHKNKTRINMCKLSKINSKILIVTHPYNIYDNYIGRPIVKILENLNAEVIYSDAFTPKITSDLSKNLSNTLYWKFNKESIGSIELIKNKIDGIIFLSSFPCGPDSIVNELVMRKIKVPYINIVIDDIDALAGIETRIESFIDIIESRKIHG